MTLHGVSLFISDNYLGFFFAKFGEVSSVSPIKSKARIDTYDVEIMSTVTRKKFTKIPNVSMCEGRPIYMVVEGRRPLCWACGTAGYLSKAYPGKTPEPQLKPTASKESAQTSSKVAKGLGE